MKNRKEWKWEIWKVLTGAHYNFSNCLLSLFSVTSMAY